MDTKQCKNNVNSYNLNGLGLEYSIQDSNIGHSSRDSPRRGVEATTRGVQVQTFLTVAGLKKVDQCVVVLSAAESTLLISVITTDFPSLN